MYFFFLFLSQIPPFSTKHGSQHSKHCFLLFPVSVCFYLCFDMCFCFGFYFWLHPHPATGLLPYCVYLFCVQSLIKLPIIPCCFYFSLWSLANCFPALLSLISSSCFLRHVFYCFFFFLFWILLLWCRHPAYWPHPKLHTTEPNIVICQYTIGVITI